MSGDSIFCAVDIGSSSIRTLIGGFKNEENSSLHILGVGVVPSNSMRKGNILDMEEFKATIDKSLEEAEKMSGEQVEGVFISFNSPFFDIISSKGIVAVSGNEITEGDIQRVLDIAKSSGDYSNKEIIKIVPDTFTVDLEEGIKSPLGMTGRKLEVKANVFAISTNIMNNLKRAIQDVGVEVYDVFPNVIASPEGVLTKRQKELGVVCIDIGASTTGVTIYEEGTLKHAKVIPLGGDSVTNDIALGLKTSIDVAEKLKIQYGKIIKEENGENEDTEIDLSTIVKGETSTISSLYLSKIITARYEEILGFVLEELKKIGRDGMLPEGAVFVGGGSKIEGITDLSKTLLKLPSFLGKPMKSEIIHDVTLNDTRLVASFGSLFLAHRYTPQKIRVSINMKSIFHSIQKLFKKFIG